jgi:hypothetical protein
MHFGIHYSNRSVSSLIQMMTSDEGVLTFLTKVSRLLTREEASGTQETQQNLFTNRKEWQDGCFLYRKHNYIKFLKND